MFPYGCQGKSLLFHFYYQSCKTSETLELEHSRGFFWKLPTILFLTANNLLFNMCEGCHYSQSNYLILEYSCQVWVPQGKLSSFQIRKKWCSLPILVWNTEGFSSTNVLLCGPHVTLTIKHTFKSFIQPEYQICLYVAAGFLRLWLAF